MTRGAFEKLVASIGLSAVPERFRDRVSNTAFLIEDEPSEEIRIAEGLLKHETLLGLYHGIPHTVRGDLYGVGVTLPDTITLYQKPIEEAAGNSDDFDAVARVVRETIWHEVAHHFGLDHSDMARRGNKL